MVERKIPHVRAPIVTATGAPTRVFYDLLERLVIAADTVELIEVMTHIELPASERMADIEEAVEAATLGIVADVQAGQGNDERDDRIDALEQLRPYTGSEDTDERLDVLEVLTRLPPSSLAAIADILERLEDLEVLGTLQRTAFGELQVAQLTPYIQVVFPYSINTEQVTAYGIGSGAVTHASELVSIASGAATSSAGVLESRETISYRSGQGIDVRFSALFGTGTANNEQIIGIGGPCDGFFFGYNGTSFGILRRRAGEREVRTLTVTVGSSHAENITITLNGVTHSVAVTNTASVTKTAREIAAHDYQASGWEARPEGDKVIFSNLTAVSGLTGAYTLSGATSATGTFAQTIAGADQTDSWTAQASWTDGLPSGMTLDQTKGNVYRIQFQYLGFGQINFFVENQATGGWALVHSIRYANQNSETSISNPTLRLYARSTNSTNNTSVALKTSSMAAFVEGVPGQAGIHFAAGTQYAIGTTTTERVLMTIRNSDTYQGRTNRVPVILATISLTNQLQGAGEIATYRFYLNGIPLTGTSYSSVEVSNSVMKYDTAASEFSTTGATLAFQITLSGGQTELIDAEKCFDRLMPGETMLVTIQISSGNANNRCGVAFNWMEAL